MDARPIFFGLLGLFATFCTMAGFALGMVGCVYVIAWSVEKGIERFFRWLDRTAEVAEYVRHRLAFKAWLRDSAGQK